MSDIECGQKLTCKQFVEEFNAISEDYNAKTDSYGGVTIEDSDYDLQVAKLWFNSQHWRFEYERVYSWKELMLMAKLAANPPMFRNPPKEREND